MADALGGAEIVPVKSTDGEPGDKERFVRGVGPGPARGRGGPRRPLGQGPSVRPSRGDQARRRASAARSQPTHTWVGAVLARRAPRRVAGRHRRAFAAASQLLALRPDLEIVELHGNVDTRLRRLAEGDYDGIVLAAAGLRRLGREMPRSRSASGSTS